MKFPYTFKEVAPWVLGALVVIGLIYLFIQWLLHRRKAIREKEDAEPAHIKALRKLDRYRGDKYWKPDQQKLFYSGVTDALSDIPPELYQEMKALFERADFVKFAKYTATEEENAKVLPQAIGFVTATYQQEIAGEAGKDEKEA